VPEEAGEDPWVTAVHYSKVTSDVEGEDMLAALLFCRGMGWRSRSAGRLLFLSVQRLSKAPAANRLSKELGGWLTGVSPGLLPSANGIAASVFSAPLPSASSIETSRQSSLAR